MSGDQVRASVAVALPPAEAFDLFTREIDLWWRRGPRYRHVSGGDALIAIEPRVGGRVFESRGGGGDGDGAPAHVIGTVRVWQPPARLVFGWRASNFAAGEETEVDVVFAPRGGGTLVTVTHRGWAAIRADHPVRHGQPSAAFVRGLGLWWGAQLTSLRERGVRS